MTRHELKEQLQHDHFKDAVWDVFGYAGAHRQQVLRWIAVAVVILIAAAGAFWYSSYQSSIRQRELQGAFSVFETPVGTAGASGKSFPNEQARRQASIKAFSDVLKKYSGTREGLIAHSRRSVYTSSVAGVDFLRTR